MLTTAQATPLDILVVLHSIKALAALNLVRRQMICAISAPLCLGPLSPRNSVALREHHRCHLGLRADTEESSAKEARHITKLYPHHCHLSVIRFLSTAGQPHASVLEEDGSCTGLELSFRVTLERTVWSAASMISDAESSLSSAKAMNPR